MIYDEPYKKKEELTSALEKFLDGNLSCGYMQEFTWDIIDHFSSSDKRKLPKEENFERVFWYAIWQVQHLATEDHISDGSAKVELKETLAYLRGELNLPDEYIGRRP